MAVASAQVERLHGPDCACTRCASTPPGNQLARKHGGYSLLGIDRHGTEIADDVRPTMPAYSPADEPVLQLFGCRLARIERGTAAIVELDEMADGKPLGPYVVDGATNFQRLRRTCEAGSASRAGSRTTSG